MGTYTRAVCYTNFVQNQLTENHIDWLQQHPSQYIVDDILFCHGTPTSDEVYLLEEMDENGAVLKSEKYNGSTPKYRTK